MTNKHAKKLVCWLWAAALATGAGAQGTSEAWAVCKTIVSSGLHEYSISSSSSAHLNRVHERYCEQNSSSSSSNASIGLDAVLEQIPIGLTGSSGSASQRMQNFCKNYHSTDVSQQASFQQQDRIVARAYDSLDRCLEMASNGAYLHHVVTSRNTFDVSMVPKTSLPIIVSGVHTSGGVECTGMVDGAARKLTESTTLKVDLQPYGFVCRRTGTPVPGTGQVLYQEAVMTVVTNLMPHGNYTVVLPEDVQMPMQYAKDIQARMDALQQEQRRLVTNVSTVNDRFSHLHLQTVCSAAGWEPRPAAPACPAGWADTGGSANFAAPGGRSGFGGRCRICYQVD